MTGCRACCGPACRSRIELEFDLDSQIGQQARNRYRQREVGYRLALQEHEQRHVAAFAVDPLQERLTRTQSLQKMQQNTFDAARAQIPGRRLQVFRGCAESAPQLSLGDRGQEFGLDGIGPLCLAHRRQPIVLRMLPLRSACRGRVARIAGSEAGVGLEFQCGGYVFGVHAGMPDAQRQLD